jgi:hypothetical protein
MRPAIFITSVLTLSLLAGCAANTDSEGAVGDDAAENALTSRPDIDLKSTSDTSSVQAKLFNLMSTFKGDADLGISSGIDSPALFMKGGKEKSVSNRSVECHTSNLVHATVGKGVTTTTSFECTLSGFDKTRAGGALPSVVLGQGEKPLAGKLFALMAKGEQKGNLGVKRTSPVTQPSCCDMPVTTSFEVSDAHGTLACSQKTGGFVSIESAECTYTVKASDEVLVQKGTLFHSAGPGGETTGITAALEDGSQVELVVSAAQRKLVVDGRVARITGTATTLSGVETHNRPAINVSNLLVCPAANTPLDLMPPVSDDTLWIAHNCPDLGVITE